MQGFSLRLVIGVEPPPHCMKELNLAVSVESSCTALIIRTAKGEIQNRKCDFLAGFTYKEQFAVVVICEDEREQEIIYNRLNEEGFKLKVVAV